MTQAGQFHKEVVIRKPDPEATRDASGRVDLSDDKNWTTHAHRFARFVNQAGREFFQAQQVQADVTDIVELFYDKETASITPTYRLEFDDRKLEILSVFNVAERNTTMKLVCKEAV